MRRRSNLSLPKFQFIHDCFPSFSRIRYRPNAKERERERDAGRANNEERDAGQPRDHPGDRPRWRDGSRKIPEITHGTCGLIRRRIAVSLKRVNSAPRFAQRAGNYGSARSRRGGDIRGASSMNRTTRRVTKLQREEDARRIRISSRNKLAEGGDSPPMKIRSDPKLLERVQPDISQARRESDARVRHVENFRVAR